MRKNSGIVLLVLFVLTGCSSLRRVHDYAGSSLSSVQNYQQLHYGFTDAWMDRLRQQYFGDYSGSFGLEADSTRPLAGSALTLDSVKRLDRSMEAIFHALEGYFTGLNRLSADSLTDYPIDTLLDPLESGKLIDTASLPATQIAAWGTIARDLSAALTARWRKRQIRQYIQQADAPLQTLIGYFTLNLRGNLTQLLESQRQVWKDDIYIDLLKQARSPFEKKQVIADYQHTLSELLLREELLRTYCRSLDLVAAGHHTLAANLGKLKTRELQAELNRYSGRIRSLYNSFHTVYQRKH